MPQDWWYTCFSSFFCSSFLSSEKMSKQQLLLLLCLLWDFQTLAHSLGDSKQVLLKTNSFQSHQRLGERRRTQSQATVSIKCLTNKNILCFIHINVYSAVGGRGPPTMWQADLYLNLLVQIKGYGCCYSGYWRGGMMVAIMMMLRWNKLW